MTKTFILVLLTVLYTTHVFGADDDLRINITILESATIEGAVCLDGSPPAYHLDRGHGTGFRSWIIYLDGGGWCNTMIDCLDRSTTFLGSSKKMNPQSLFNGILHNTSKQNSEFYNWNRVKVKYCDGSSFTGDVEQVDPDKLYFRGARIFKAIMEDLWRKGINNAENAILCGISAGGLATILNCDKFKSLLPESATVKCIADAGFFINGKTIFGTSYIQEIYRNVVSLHAFNGLIPSFTRGYFITSCHSHGGILSSQFLLSPISQTLPHKTIGEAIADWYFEREGLQYIDPYPCAKDCKL